MSTSQPELVQIDHVTKSFGEKIALKDVVRSAFFAIYHQPYSWLPVALVGLANAIIFKKTGRLAPAVILHMVYNAIVLY